MIPICHLVTDTSGTQAHHTCAVAFSLKISLENTDTHAIFYSIKKILYLSVTNETSRNQLLNCFVSSFEHRETK